MQKSIYKLSALCALALTGISHGVSAEQQNPSQENKAMLQCKIEAPVTAKVGGPVELTFTLSNSGEDKLAVLKWNTPFEGWFGQSFNVTRDGQWVAYQGAMVKRFRPSEEDYAELLPGKSLSAKVNMAEGYDMKAPGNYKLVFNGRLQDVQVLSDGKAVAPGINLQSIKCNELTVTLQ